MYIPAIFIKLMRILRLPVPSQKTIDRIYSALPFAGRQRRPLAGKQAIIRLKAMAKTYFPEWSAKLARIVARRALDPKTRAKGEILIILNWIEANPLTRHPPRKNLNTNALGRRSFSQRTKSSRYAEALFVYMQSLSAPMICASQCMPGRSCYHSILHSIYSNKESCRLIEGGIEGLAAHMLRVGDCTEQQTFLNNHRNVREIYTLGVTCHKISSDPDHVQHCTKHHTKLTEDSLTLALLQFFPSSVWDGEAITGTSDEDKIAELNKRLSALVGKDVPQCVDDACEDTECTTWYHTAPLYHRREDA